MATTFLACGAISALLAVAAGAFGAHALKSRLDAESLAIFEVAVRYQMYHALALVATAWVIDRWGTGRAAGWLFIAGTVLFSGSLYLLVATGRRTWGALTPFGGVAFLLGWAVLALVALRS